ncbi:MAG: orotate phosphoribosyltransferase [Candidatus Aenigmatarchaeota archaeon]|nr:MAG: orotate phosphoribosyltransferase [Candidatus Aenigmarchaeota archaeon]
MEKAGICMHCKDLANPAYSCKMCGAMVCSNCFDHELGVCRACVEKIKPGKKKDLKDKIKSIE